MVIHQRHAAELLCPFLAALSKTALREQVQMLMGVAEYSGALEQRV